MHKLLLYFGDELIGDINRYSKNRHLVETLKSESGAEGATADVFTFDINWKMFSNFIAKHSTENPASFLRVGKTRVVFETNGYVRFAGYLAARPARSGVGSDQMLSLTFYEYFARLAGDLVCADDDKTSPMREYTNVRADVFAQDLINLFMTHAAAAGETLNWSFGEVATLGNKSKTFKDFQTIAKALCDAMDNVEGAGKFDIVFRTNQLNYTQQLIDILKPRGTSKNIIIKYPSDGVYRLFASEYSISETNDFASEVLIAGNGQVGDVEAGEQTAKMGVAEDLTVAQNYCYCRVYETASNLFSQTAVNDRAKTRLSQLSFPKETPQIRLVGRPIAWGQADNMNNGLALGDTFYFQEETDDASDNSGFYRIIGLDSTWDDNGVETVEPTLLEGE